MPNVTMCLLHISYYTVVTYMCIVVFFKIIEVVFLDKSTSYCMVVRKDLDLPPLERFDDHFWLFPLILVINWRVWGKGFFFRGAAGGISF